MQFCLVLETDNQRCQSFRIIDWSSAFFLLLTARQFYDSGMSLRRQLKTHFLVKYWRDVLSALGIL